MVRFLLLVVILICGSYVEAEELHIPEANYRDAAKVQLSEMECLALNIYHEARGESYTGQEYVAQVTMNRLRAGFRGATTVCDVVFSRKQFSWTHDGLPDWALDDAAWRKAYLIAVDFFHYKKKVNDRHAETMLFYYNPKKADPYWADGMNFKKIGNHLFSYNA